MYDIVIDFVKSFDVCGCDLDIVEMFVYGMIFCCVDLFERGG